MKTAPLHRITLRILSIFLMVVPAMACREDDPDDPDNPEQIEAVVHNFSDQNNANVEVVSIDINEDGNRVLTINAPKDQIPKVGEYLVSTPTELAPYGYLLKVTNVTEDSETRGIDDTIDVIRASIETVFAGLNEIIHNISFKKVFCIPLPDMSFEDFKPILEGLKCTMEVSRDDTGMENLPFDADGNLQNPENFAFNADGDLEFIHPEISGFDGQDVITAYDPEEKKKGNKAKVSFEGFEIDGITIKPEFSFTQKGLFFFLEITEGTFQKMGVDYEANLSCSLEILDTFKGKLIDKKIPLGSLVQSYIVPVGEVPVVVTVVCPIILEFKVDGSIGFGIKPLDVDLDIGMGAYYDFPRESFFPYWGHDEYVDITDKTSQKEYSGLGNIDTDLTLKGSVSLDLSTGVSVGFFGCNIIDRKAGWMIDGKRPDGNPRTPIEKKLLKEFKDVLEAEFTVDVKGAVSAKVEVGSIDEVAADLYFRDDCGLKVDWGAKLAASFKIPFVSSIIPPWIYEVVDRYGPWDEPAKIGIVTPSWDSPRGVIFDSSKKKKWPHTLFFPGYSDLKVEDGPDDHSVIVASVTKTKPLSQRLGFQPFNERSWGLCLVPSDLKNEAAGPFSSNWTMHDLTANPNYAFKESESWVDIYEAIPKSGLEYNRYYDLYAYSIVEGPLFGDIYLLRANKQFRLSESGKVSTINLDDVPGQNL